MVILYLRGITMKLCKTCNTEKDLFQFGSRKASLDGLSPKCKSCQSSYDKNRANDPKRVAARLSYSKTDAGIQSSNKAKKKWSENNKGKIAKSQVKYRELNPKKLMCHGIVGYAIKCTKLTREPCEVCGDIKVHGHHDDYNEPMNVRWLCCIHHKQWHVEHGEGLNAS